jgi:membrane-associated phospholipid phosphatase
MNSSAAMNAGLLPLDRWLLRNRKGALGLAAALGAFVPICWIVIKVNGSFPGDRILISWMRNPHHSEPFAWIANKFSVLGNGLPSCVSVAIAWVLVERYLGRRYAMLMLASVGVVALNEILKRAVGPTPLELKVFGENVAPNFPSGHVVYLTSLCAPLAWFALARHKRLIFTAMVLLTLGMGPFRIVAGAHWPSDVLAGYALALAWTITVLVVGLPWAAAGRSRVSARSPTRPRA